MTISVDGDADAAVEARNQIGWNKFRQLEPLITNKDTSLIVRRLCKKDCHASKLNRDDAMDRSRWRKHIKDD